MTMTTTMKGSVIRHLLTLKWAKLHLVPLPTTSTVFTGPPWCSGSNLMIWKKENKTMALAGDHIFQKEDKLQSLMAKDTNLWLSGVHVFESQRCISLRARGAYLWETEVHIFESQRCISLRARGAYLWEPEVHIFWSQRCISFGARGAYLEVHTFVSHKWPWDFPCHTNVSNTAESSSLSFTIVRLQ